MDCGSRAFDFNLVHESLSEWQSAYCGTLDSLPENKLIAAIESFPLACALNCPSSEYLEQIVA